MSGNVMCSDDFVLSDIRVATMSAEGHLASVLKNIELALSPGEWINVVGVNGSGKSTLARMLAGLTTEGAQGTLRRGFAGEGPAPYVMQHPDAQLFGETPREEIVFALEWLGLPAEEIARHTERVLEVTGMRAIADHSWENLSGGQRQLAAVAAASAGEAALIVFDEATSMLDDASREKVHQLAKRLNEDGTAVVWVTQRLDELDPSSRVVALSGGRVVYDGEGRRFLYGEEQSAEMQTPCEQCGLRLPYMASLAAGLKRLGQLDCPLPVAIEERRKATRPDRKKEQPVPLTITGLKDMNGQYTEWKLEQGTITVLMGPNGAGKTRLMEIAAGLIFSPEITVSYGNENMWIHNGLRRRQRNPAALLAYSYACQTPEEQLFSRTVAEELRYVLRPYNLPQQEERRRIDEALNAVGWNRDWLERDPYRMSGGERRRTALACLFAAPASWLLLDEPTAGLDAQGHALLGTALAKRAADKQGVLLISHDTDWALALADTILLMNADGAVRQCGRDELLANPDWLRQAGMSVPEWLMVAHAMWKSGVPAHLVWNPADLAAEMAQLAEAGTKLDLEFKWEKSPDDEGAWTKREKALKEPGAKRDKAPEEQWTKREKWPREPEAKREESPDEQRSGRKAAPQSRLAAFEPRSVWLAYILLSIGMFLQKTWTGVALIGLLTAAAIAAARLPLLRWRGPIAALGLFSLMIAVFAGLGGDGSGSLWSTEAFLLSLRSLMRPWLAMLLGLLIPLAITPLRLRRSLEQMLTIRGRVPFLGQKIILTVTLLLRFIPILLGEWERFSRISIARGKAARPAGGAARRLRDTAIPFLLSLFRLGEQVADALESRGVGKQRRTAFPVTGRWRLRDSLLVAGSLGITVFLWWWAGGGGI